MQNSFTQTRFQSGKPKLSLTMQQFSERVATHKKQAFQLSSLMLFSRIFRLGWLCNDLQRFRRQRGRVVSVSDAIRRHRDSSPALTTTRICFSVAPSSNPRPCL